MKEDEQRLNEDINRAELARQIIDSPIYQEALLVMKAQLMDVFQSTKFKESDERDEIWRKMQTLNNFEGYFEQLMESGKFAKATLSQKIKNVVGF